jgi:hypothetical protein
MTAARSAPTTATGGDARLETVRALLRSRLGIDPRALAAFRIGLALVVCADLLVLRLPGLGTFYTDGGVFPRSALAGTSPTLAKVSLHALSGSVWWQVLLLGVTLAAAGALLVGYRHRVAAPVTAVLLASLYARNPYLVNGGDTILVSLLVLAAALPLDARWSVRGRRLEGRPADPDATDPRVLSAATATILLHVVFIYAINAALKFRSEAWTSGVAVRRIFRLEDYVYLLGPTLAEYPAALTGINWLWTAVLSASVLLVLATGRLRTATVLAFVGAHLGMAATMRLGAFPFVMISVLLLYLPPRVWDRVDRLVPADGPGPLAAASGSESTGGDSPRRRGTRPAVAALLACFLLVVVGWQLLAAGFVDGPTPGDGKLESASWAFFAPDPPDSYNWYVVEAERPSGGAIDLVDGEPVDFDRPPDAMDRYPTTLWKRYGTKARHAGAAQFRPAAAYFCDRAPDAVESVTIHRVEQPVDANGPVGEPVPRERATVACG